MASGGRRLQLRAARKRTAVVERERERAAWLDTEWPLLCRRGLYGYSLYFFTIAPARKRRHVSVVAPPIFRFCNVAL